MEKSWGVTGRFVKLLISPEKIEGDGVGFGRLSKILKSGTLQIERSSGPPRLTASLCKRTGG